MINNRFNSKRTANGGFTLVELLVVIGIIAILAGVALGPITNGIKKAKQSSGMQVGHVLALSEFSFANDHDASYPDLSNQAGNSGTGAGSIIAALVGGKYVSDPTIFLLSGSGATKVAIADVGSAGPTNSSFDFVGISTGKGLDSNTPDGMPVLWSTNSAGPLGDLTSITGTSDLSVSLATGTKGAFGTDGLVVAFKNNGSKFVQAQGTAGKVDVTPDSNFTGQANAVVLAGAQL